MRHNPLCQISLLFLILSLTASIAFAAYENSADWLQEWSYWDTANRATYTSSMTAGFVNLTSLEDYCPVPLHSMNGFSYIIENETGSKLVIMQTTTTIEVFDPQICDVVTDISTPSPIAQVGYKETASGNRVIVIPNSNQTFSIYNLSNNLLTHANTTGVIPGGEIITGSGVMCAYTNGADRCYYQTQRGNLVAINLSDNTMTTHVVLNGAYNDTLNNMRTPALGTWSSADHIIVSGMVGTISDTSGIAGMCVWLPSSETYYTTWGGTGCINITSTAYGWFVTNPMTSKIGSGSNPQISVGFVNRGHPGGVDSHYSIRNELITYSVSGAEYMSVQGYFFAGTGYTVGLSNPFIIYNGSAPMHCIFADTNMVTSTFPAFNFGKVLMCNSAYGSFTTSIISRVQNTVAPSTSGICVPYKAGSEVGKCNAVVADFDSARTQKEVITAYGYWNIDGSTMTVTNISAWYNSTFTSVGDLNSDYSLDLIYQNGAAAYMKTITYSNTPPTLNNTLDYGGYYGYMNPVCVNTTATFNAHECTLAVPLACNYVNDNEFDEERLVTDCGITGAATNGSWNIDAPSFSCYYNTTGTYNVQIYLQDDRNVGDMTQYNTLSIPIVVMNGVPGVTCNIASTTITSPIDQGAGGGAGSAQIDAAIDSTMGILFGTSTKVKAIVGIGLVIGICAGVAASTGSGFAVAIAGILGLILVTAIGFISAYILILGLVGGVLMLIISKFVAGGSDGGG